MDVFNLDGALVSDYQRFARSFTRIRAADKLRQRTGLTDDGGILVDRALGGDLPLLAINNLSTESEKSEQKGFCNLVKGAFGMFRNTTAHAPKISWAINKEDAEEAFTLLSLIHKRIDAGNMPSRV